MSARRTASTRYFVYLLRCGDGTLYCGIARDVSARLAAHAEGKGARYTRGRGPLVLVATRRCADKSLALRIEHAVKRLTRAEKLAIVAAPDGLVRIARKASRQRAEGRLSRATTPIATHRSGAGAGVRRVKRSRSPF